MKVLVFTDNQWIEHDDNTCTCIMCTGWGFGSNQ